MTDQNIEPLVLDKLVIFPADAKEPKDGAKRSHDKVRQAYPREDLRDCTQLDIFKEFIGVVRPSSQAVGLMRHALKSAEGLKNSHGGSSFMAVSAA